MTEPRIAVLGAGAIGCLFAAALAQAGRDVTLLLRSGNAAANQLRFTALGEEQAQALQLPVRAMDDLTAAPDIVLVCTKAQQVVPALKSIPPPWLEHSQWVLMHNGMGVLEQLPADLRTAPIFSAVTSQAAYREQALTVRHTGRGATMLGASLNANVDDAAAVTAILNTDLCPLEAVPDIELMQWRKLAVNCALNPLTALFECSNGEVGEHPVAAPLQQRLSTEIQAVGAAIGGEFALPALDAQLQAVMTATYHNRNSMRCDIEAGVATEIDYINGYLLRRAEQLEVAVPTHREMVQRIRELESRGAGGKTEI